VVEEHGGGRQLARFRIWPQVKPGIIIMAAAISVFGLLALRDDMVVVAAILLCGALLLSGWAMIEASASTGMLLRAVQSLER
jgi:hypothetical protein